MSSEKMDNLNNMYVSSHAQSKIPGGLRVCSIGQVRFQLSDLFEYENNKEFYNSKLYKHLAGYNDEET
jgi:hypothetical protein